MNKGKAIDIGKIKVNSFEWFVTHYTPSIQQQALLSKPFLSETPTELHYVDRSVSQTEINTQNLWSFELGTQEDVKTLYMDYCWFSTKR